MDPVLAPSPHEQMQGSSITPADRQRRLDAILERHGKARTELVQILREAQEPEGWIRPEAIGAIARALKLPRARVEGVAGFYSFLHVAPGGRYRLLFSDNITDRMAGSEPLLARLCELLWVERGRTSEDALVSVDTTSCTGMCDQAPALLANGWAIPRLTADRVEQIAELVRGGQPVERWPREWRRANRSAPRWRAAAVRCARRRSTNARGARRSRSRRRGRAPCSRN
ncbi:MAG: NAD(P)H-dependent oxidoreductase subunit E [Burkholderiaceae bacterium]|nr:NAD(P)H-dependent oxidoreductase subunit E [Burkholderiaceae bacterium]